MLLTGAQYTLVTKNCTPSPIHPAGECDQGRAADLTQFYSCVNKLLCKRKSFRPLQEKVIKDVLLVDQPIKRFVKPEEVRCVLCS